jgi:hypothetical protein
MKKQEETKLIAEERNKKNEIRVRNKFKIDYKEK